MIDKTPTLQRKKDNHEITHREQRFNIGAFAKSLTYSIVGPIQDEFPSPRRNDEKKRLAGNLDDSLTRYIFSKSDIKEYPRKAKEIEPKLEEIGNSIKKILEELRQKVDDPKLKNMDVENIFKTINEEIDAKIEGKIQAAKESGQAR